MHSEPACPLCPSNGKVDIVDEAAAAYLTEAKNPPIEDCFLIAPKEHITNILELPPRWQTDFNTLLGSVPWHKEPNSYNISTNVGVAAGQTLAHIHYWVIPRTEVPGDHTHNKGMATLLYEARLLMRYIRS